MANTGAIKGKLEVDLYANPDPMIQGFMRGEAAAKKYGGSIGDSIEYMNKKQMKSAAHGLLGGFTTIGLVESGAKMALELTKGFKDGSVKSFGDAAALLGKTIETGLQGIPIAGTFLMIGKEIGNMIFGVDAANVALNRTNEQMERTQGIVKGLQASQFDTAAQMAALDKTNSDFGKSPDKLASEKFRADKLKEIDANRDRMNKDVDKRKSDMQAEVDPNGAFHIEQQKQSDGSTILKKIYDEKLNSIEKINAETERGYNLSKKTQDEALLNVDSLQKEFESKQKIHSDDIKNADEAVQKQKEYDDAQKIVWNMQDEAARAGMTARDAKLDELAAVKSMTNEMILQAIAAWDIQAAAEAHKKELEQIPDAQKKAKEAFSSEVEAFIDLNRAKADRTASATSVDTALGSIKLAGVTDFSKSKEIENAQKAFSKATETAASTKGTYDQLLILNKSLGGLP